MSQTKPEHPSEATPTAESATGGLDREWQRKQREEQRKYETKRVQAGPADSARVKAYKEQTDRAGRMTMELLRDHQFRDVFRERIRFAVAPYKDYERRREEENRRQTKQRNIDLAAAARDPKRRDKNAKPPSKAYSWVQPEGCWMRRFAHADISPAPWLQAFLDGERSDDESELLPAYYGILAAIHDKHPDNRTWRITKRDWPEYLLDHVWRLLDPLHGLPAETIQDAVKAVERDLTATIEAQPTTGEKPGLSMTGETVSESKSKQPTKFPAEQEVSPKTYTLKPLLPTDIDLHEPLPKVVRAYANSWQKWAHDTDADLRQSHASQLVTQVYNVGFVTADFHRYIEGIITTGFRLLDGFNLLIERSRMKRAELAAGLIEIRDTLRENLREADKANDEDAAKHRQVPENPPELSLENPERFLFPLWGMSLTTRVVTLVMPELVERLRILADGAEKQPEGREPQAGGKGSGESGTPKGGEVHSKLAEGKASGTGPGRRRKHDRQTVDLASKAFDSQYAEEKDAKKAWNKVAELYGFASGDAARSAVYRHRCAHNEQN